MRRSKSEVVMKSAVENGMILWMWPLTAVELASDWVETMSSARSVIEMRMPLISATLIDPFNADQRELTRMLTEKTSAFGRSQRSIASARERLRKTGGANARAFGRLWEGGWLNWSAWTQVAERNLEIWATLAALPTAALAPVHSAATMNARRLRAKGAAKR
ncbi:hypothetical protein [Sphingobium algorifonticola]|uniref:Uncharacterized protein n=1 Tax=Sphingobium algorifonticola TaxID=2008318 RepID=A0A437J4K7_9SPHN|nr:hypothetical protein [Sphingobium algorifonticola]RVT39635.1 hypothetical protein ENE74_14845 [Sphingobium algorifonticola]